MAMKGHSAFLKTSAFLFCVISRTTVWGFYPSEEMHWWILQPMSTGQEFFCFALLLSSVLFSVSSNTSPGLHPRPRIKEDHNYMHLMYFCFLLLLLSHILLSHWSCSSKKISRNVKCNFLHFMLAGIARYLVNVFICPSLDHNLDLNYYW